MPYPADDVRKGRQAEMEEHRSRLEGYILKQLGKPGIEVETRDVPGGYKTFKALQFGDPLLAVHLKLDARGADVILARLDSLRRNARGEGFRQDLGDRRATAEFLSALRRMIDATYVEPATTTADMAEAVRSLIVAVGEDAPEALAKILASHLSDMDLKEVFDSVAEAGARRRTSPGPG